jgi:MFS family permease
MARQPTEGRRVPDGVVLALACVAQFMVVLDVSIVNVALPSVGRDLHYSASGLQWVVSAYVLTFAGFLLFGGRAADLFGRRRVYLFVSFSQVIRQRHPEPLSAASPARRTRTTDGAVHGTSR